MRFAKVTWHKIHGLKNNMAFKKKQIFCIFPRCFPKNLLSLDTNFVSLSYVPQQFGYEINSRTLLNGTYCTQCGELLIAMCNGNLTQNSLVEKKYGIQKETNYLHISTCSRKNLLSLDTNFFSVSYVLQQFGYQIKSNTS